MKKANVQIVSVSADCPDCKGGLCDPESGSLYIPVNQYGPDQLFECTVCFKKFPLEMKAWK